MQPDDQIRTFRSSPQSRRGRHGRERYALTQNARPFQAACGFWLSVWLGTAAAGGVFGLVVAGLAGFVLGYIAAGFYAIPLHLALATVAWLLRLSRHRVALGGFAGGLTGVVATLATFDPGLFELPFWTAILLAGLIGTLGGAAGALCSSLTRFKRELLDADKHDQQFTLRRLLASVAVVALVFGGVRYVLDLRERSRCQLLSCNFKAVGFALHEYQKVAGSLPYPVRHAGDGADLVPAAHVPEATPLYSWRFNILPLLGASAQISFDKPWDDPAQRKWHTRFGDAFCLDEASRQSGETNIVAITGPGTAFGDDRSESPRSLDDLDADTILAVEVRRSGIPWMAPGDLDIRAVPRQPNKNNGPRIGGCHSPGFHVLFADGDVWILSNNAPFAELRKFFTVESAKEFDRDEVLRPYFVGSWY